LTGYVDTGKAALRDYINATIGFDGLGKATDRSPKSLMRMFDPNSQIVYWLNGLTENNLFRKYSQDT
jgi:hypothetical protein